MKAKYEIEVLDKGCIVANGGTKVAKSGEPVGIWQALTTEFRQLFLEKMEEGAGTEFVFEISVKKL